MTCSQITPPSPSGHTDTEESSSGHPSAPAGRIILYVFLVSRVIGEPAVLLVERQQGLVEFPALTLTPEELSDNETIVLRIKSETGLDAVVEGYIDVPSDASLTPPGSRFLLARVPGGRPEIAGECLGWEWHPVASLLSMEFLPKLMVNELRSYMSG